jgi:hypothetical protein
MLREYLPAFRKILAIATFAFCLPLMAQERNAWQFDSLGSKSDIANDIEGLLEAYWKSPDLLVVIDSEQINGWQQLHDSYIKDYPNRSAMGFIEPSRIQVRLLKPDLALALTWWTINLPSSNERVVGNTTMNLQKFDDGWKIVASHFSTTEM